VRECGAHFGAPQSDTTMAGPVPAAPVTKVSANMATREELRAAFEGAGVPNADMWAEQIPNYRPFPADDPNFDQLRSELERFNAGTGVVDRILSVLAP